MDRKGLAIMVLAAVILILLVAPQKSRFTADAAVSGMSLTNSAATGNRHARAVAGRSAAEVPQGEGPYLAGGDMSSAGLIPREVVQTEDFGQFSPEAILSGQNYMDPRSQIGYPETLGGVLRNANQPVRSEPINPRTPVSIFNLSTIPPDTMRPKFEISPEYQ
jgi:hypothetical protein